MVEIFTDQKEQTLSVHLPFPDTVWIVNVKGIEILRFEMTEHFELDLGSLPQDDYYVHAKSGFSARFKKNW